MLNLRPYQTTMLRAVIETLMQNDSPLGVMPTGGGKSAIIADLTRQLDFSGARVLLLAHRRELVEQLHETLSEFGVTTGIVGDRSTDQAANVRVGTCGTVARRLDQIDRPDYLQIDEAHHAVSPSYGTIIEALGCPVVGWIATPERLDGNGLGRDVGGPFGRMIVGPDITTLTAGRYLVPAIVYACNPPDLTGVKSRAGDYDSLATRKIMETAGRIVEIVDNYRQHGDNRKALAFVTSFQQARRVAAAFNGAGITALAVSGDDPKAVRSAAFAALRAGTVRVIVSCELISEGINVPDVGCVILARPTQSLTVYLQQVGRGLRTAPGKSNLIVLDHAGNTARHGYANTPRQWDLNATKNTRPAPPRLRDCAGCGALVPLNTRDCPHCGRVLIVPEIEDEIVTTPRVLQRLTDQHGNPLISTQSLSAAPSPRRRLWRSRSANAYCPEITATVYPDQRSGQYKHVMTGPSGTPVYSRAGYSSASEAQIAAEAAYSSIYGGHTP